MKLPKNDFDLAQHIKDQARIEVIDELKRIEVRGVYLFGNKGGRPINMSLEQFMNNITDNLSKNFNEVKLSKLGEKNEQ